MDNSIYKWTTILGNLHMVFMGEYGISGIYCETYSCWFKLCDQFLKSSLMQKPRILRKPSVSGKGGRLPIWTVIWNTISGIDPPNCRVRFESRVDITTVLNMINMWFSWPQWLTVAHILLTYCIHSCEACPLSGVLAESGWFKSHCPQIHPHNYPHNHPRHSPTWLSYVLELIYQRIQRGPRSDASTIFNLEDLWKIQK